MAEPKKFTDLEAASTSTEAVPVDFKNVPDQFSTREPLPQPAKGIVFKMQPVSLEDSIWDEIQTDNGPRVAVTLDPKKNKGLVIQKYPGDRYIGQQLRARISNKERAAREDDESGPSSDMAYLIMAAKGNDLSGQPTMAYAQEIVRLSKAGATFRADLEYSARCDPERDIFGENAEGETEVLKDVKGCGQRYGMRAYTNRRTGEKTKGVPRDGAGEWQERFECASPGCKAIISVFANLRNFQPVE